MLWGFAYLLYVMLVVAAIAIAIVEYTKGFVAPAATAAAVALLAYFFFDVNLFHQFLLNPIAYVSYALIYIIIGIPFVLVKWYLYARACSARIKTDINDYYKFYTRGFGTDRRLDASKYKSLFATWAVFWPFVILITFILEPLKHFASLLYSVFGDILQKISDKAYDNS